MSKHSLYRDIVLTTAAALVLALQGMAASAEDYTAGSLQIGNPWTRATPRGADVAGAYFTITNKGTTPDRLLSGSTTVAGRFEIHNQTVEKGVAKMRPVTQGLELKPGATVELKPGGLHVMLVGLKEPIQQGQRIKGTLVFEKAGKVEVEFPVEALGASRAPVDHSGQHKGH